MISVTKWWLLPFLPGVFIVSTEAWTEKPKEDDDETWKWFLVATSECLAFYHPESNIIFIREDAFSLRILLHEAVHWFLWKLFRRQWGVQDWWDRHTLFRWHMVSVSLRVGFITREELDSWLR